MKSGVCMLSFLLLLVLSSCADASADDGVPALRICTQNLNRFGAKQGRKSNKGTDKQKDFLVERMAAARCVIIALQEVWGETKGQAEKTMGLLASGLRQRTGKTFEAYLGETLDKEIRNGFLVAHDAGRVSEVRQYLRNPLPRLQTLGPAGNYMRGPLGILVELQPPSVRSHLFVVTMHFKSKAGSWKDPSNTQFEALRMEMAAGLLRDVGRDLQKMPPETVLVVLGDTNSDYDSAAIDVLEGERSIDDFSIERRCTLNSKLQSVCSNAQNQPQLVRLFEPYADGRTFRGSYKFGKRWLLLDNVFVRPDDIHLFKRSDGSLASGLEGRIYKGSDHKLVWAEIFPSGVAYASGK